MEEKIEVGKKSPRKKSTKNRPKVVYPYELRLKAVKLHLEDGISREVISRELGVGESSVSVWLRLYRKEGEEGLRTRPRGARPGQKRLPEPVTARIVELKKAEPSWGVKRRAKLPSERDLAISYDCNFLTVRKALKRLVDDGTVIRRVGSGTFIAKHIEDVSTALGPKEDRIGILVYQDSNAYAYRVLQAIAHASIERKIDLRSLWVRDFSAESLARVDILKRDQCVALTLPWFPHEQVNEVRRFVQNCPLPVSLPLVIPGLEKNCFEQQEIFGASSTTMPVEDSCRYYRALGQERVALIGPDSADDLILQRKISGYIHYTSRENMTSLCGLVGPGAAAMDQLAERWKAYRGNLAIISYDDEHALRFITAMHKIGLTAPLDYRIMGYNDTEGGRFSDPPLTTIHQNFDYIGDWMLKSAVALAKGQVCQSSETPKLRMLVRESCGGRDRINDAFCAQFEHIDITVDSPNSPEALALEHAYATPLLGETIAPDHQQTSAVA